MPDLPKTVLAAIDFSSTSDCATSLAHILAQRFQAELHVLHVRRKIDAPGLDEETLDKVERLLESGDSRTFELLEQYTKLAGGVPSHGHIEHRPSVAHAIVEMAGNLGCELVVMGTHGRTGLRHMLMGSVAEKVVRLSRVPVLTAHENNGVCNRTPENIVVAHDFSEHSLEAIRHAAAWARLGAAKVTLLHAIQPLVYNEVYALSEYSGAVWERIIARCHEALEKAGAKHLHGLSYSTTVVEAHPARGITRYASEHGCDLVVIATRGLSGLEHSIVGSVAEWVVRLSPVPVLTVR